MVEGYLLLLSPLLAYLVLRIAVMSPVGLPDPSIHTTYVIDPRAFFDRYTEALSSTARLREGARVGFLVPARISYELFGALLGFVVFRYLLALVAIVPAYLLCRRLYGRPAGALAVVLILSCPVVILAWGTDFPDSAAVSYLIASISCLAMALEPRRRLVWVGVAAAFVTMAIWAFAASAFVGGVAVVCYLVIRAVNDRRLPLGDVGVLAVVAIVVTGLLAVGSFFLLGQLDFILPTLHAVSYLSQPSQKVLWHSKSWRWLPYDSYLLVPPAVVAVFVVAFARRLKHVPVAQAFLGVALVGQLALAAYLQFFGGIEILEVHFWSSILWAGTCLTAAVVLVELSRSLGANRFATWLPFAAVLAVPLAYEADPNVPAFQWDPTGISVVAILIVVAVVARMAGYRSVPGKSEEASARLSLWTGAVALLSVVLIAGGLLVLTVAPTLPHKPLPNTVGDPTPAFAATLGGDDTLAIDRYRVVAQLPGFAGKPAYHGEQLLIWWPLSQFGPMVEPMGIFHAGFNSVPGAWGGLDASGMRKIEQRRPGQILLMSTTGQGFESCLQSLVAFSPRLARTGVLTAGPVALHVWLIDLERYVRAESR